MVDVSSDELREEIAAILLNGDLTKMSVRSVRKHIEEKLDVDLSGRKREFDDLVMEYLRGGEEYRVKS